MLATFSLYECAVTVDIRALTVQYIDAALQIIFSSAIGSLPKCSWFCQIMSNFILTSELY